MSKGAFHVYNIIIFVLLLEFNSLVLFAFGIGEGGMVFSDWFPIILSFIIWGIFYRIQFIKPSRSFRICWFIFMVITLYFWQTGLGAMIGRSLF